jgi:hypothetical protein
LVIRVSRDPAENTSTSPLARADELAEAEADGDEGALADVDAAGVDEDDEDDELLQAAAVRPTHAMPATTANRLAVVPKVSIPRR